MTKDDSAFHSKSLPFSAILDLLRLNLLMIAVVSCAPCCAQGVHINLIKADGINKLREHVIKVPSLEIVVEKDTAINEPVYFQKVLGTQLLRGYILNGHEQAFYRLDNDWNFQEIPSSMAPANARYESDHDEYVEPKPLTNCTIRGKRLPGEPVFYDTVIYRDGKPISSIRLPAAFYGGTFIDNGRSLFLGAAIIRDITKPQLERINAPRGDWFGDPRQPVTYCIAQTSDSHLWLYRFDVRADRNPVGLCDLGLNSSPISFQTKRFDWINNRLILLGYNGKLSQVIDLRTGRVLARLRSSGTFNPSFSMIPGTQNRLALYDRQIVDLTNGAATPVPGLEGRSCFSKDGRYMFYASQKEGTLGDLTNIRVFDVAGRKPLGSISLNSQSAPQLSHVPPVVRDIIVADRDHIIVLTGSPATYIPNSF
jgi:hypothetical protein